MTSMLSSIKGGSAGTAKSHVEVPTVGPASPRIPHIMSLCSVKNSVSRNNHPLSLHAVSDMVKSQCESQGTVHVICCVEEKFPCGPLGNAIGRAFPLFTRKTGSGNEDEDGDNDDSGASGEEKGGRVVHVTFLDGDGKIVKDSRQIEAAKAAAEGVRLACRFVGELYGCKDCFLCVVYEVEHHTFVSHLFHAKSICKTTMTKHQHIRHASRGTNNHSICTRMPRSIQRHTNCIH